MLFNSIRFIIFFVVVYSLYLVGSRRYQNRLLLVASYVFYAAWDWRFLSLIALSTVVDYYCGLRVRAGGLPRPRYLILSLITNLSLLGFFKYFNWLSDSFAQLLSAFGMHPDPVTLNVLLPVGISFYTFQTLSYTIDVYRGELEPVRDFGDFALFVSFFPQLVAGPIERASSLLPQIGSDRVISRQEIQKGCWLIAFGYFLKVFVADNLALVADYGFRIDRIPSGMEALTSIYAFAFQIFGDFAGYSSIAIGLAKLMGFDLMTNFGFPYFVTNPQAFWRHWHISLSTWLRDYLYVPLGGNRHGKWSTYRNLFLTMLLGGIWHGAAWTFVIWGIYQGAALIAYRLARPALLAAAPSGAVASRAWRLLAVVGMFHVTCLGWLIFRAKSWEQLHTLAGRIVADLGSASPVAMFNVRSLLFYATPLIALQLFQWVRGDQYAVLKIRPGLQAAIYVAMFFLVFAWGEMGAHEFIYFQF